MKKGPCFTGCIALLLAALFSLAGCGSAGDGSSPPGNTDTAVTLNGVSANGSSTETTTRLILTFSQAISGLGADDITLSGVAGVVKGTFSGSGPTYTLGVSGFGASGILSVSVAKTGYAVSGSPKTAAIYFKGSSGTTVGFNALTANGSSTETTTQLTLTFSQAIPGLSAADIILSGVAGIVKGTLSGAGPTYTLDVSGFTSGGTLSVSAIKAGYLISPSPKTVAVYYYSGGSGPGIVGYIGADGSSTQTTTRLWIFFDDGNGGEVAEIAGFSVDDITLSGVPGIRKDELIQIF